MPTLAELEARIIVLENRLNTYSNPSVPAPSFGGAVGTGIVTLVTGGTGIIVAATGAVVFGIENIPLLATFIEANNNNKDKIEYDGLSRLNSTGDIAVTRIRLAHVLMQEIGVSELDNVLGSYGSSVVQASEKSHFTFDESYRADWDKFIQEDFNPIKEELKLPLLEFGVVLRLENILRDNPNIASGVEKLLSFGAAVPPTEMWLGLSTMIPEQINTLENLPWDFETYSTDGFGEPQLLTMLENPILGRLFLDNYINIQSSSSEESINGVGLSDEIMSNPNLLPELDNAPSLVNLLQEIINSPEIQTALINLISQKLTENLSSENTNDTQGSVFSDKINQIITDRLRVAGLSPFTLNVGTALVSQGLTWLEHELGVNGDGT